jgi:integrase
VRRRYGTGAGGVEGLPAVASLGVSERTDGPPYTADGLRTMLRRALHRAGIIKVVLFHTLRHTLATRLTASNVDIKTVSAILGHSTPRMLLERYAA